MSSAPLGTSTGSPARRHGRSAARLALPGLVIQLGTPKSAGRAWVEVTRTRGTRHVGYRHRRCRCRVHRSHLVELLAAWGERVVAVDRRPGAPASAAACMVAELGPDPDGSIADALRGADAVFHLATRPGVRDPGPEATTSSAATPTALASEPLPNSRPSATTSPSNPSPPDTREFSFQDEAGGSSPARPTTGYDQRKC